MLDEVSMCAHIVGCGGGVGECMKKVRKVSLLL